MKRKESVLSADSPIPNEGKCTLSKQSNYSASLNGPIDHGSDILTKHCRSVDGIK